jgi:hypothetical protein
MKAEFFFPAELISVFQEKLSAILLISRLRNLTLFTLMTEAVNSPETPVFIYHTTRHNPEDNHLRCNLFSRVISLGYSGQNTSLNCRFFHLLRSEVFLLSFSRSEFEAEAQSWYLLALVLKSI